MVEPGNPGVDGGMGIDGSTHGSDVVRADVAVGNGLPFVQMAVGSLSSCSIRSDTSLWCWGNNTYGQLRVSGATDRLTPVEVSGLLGLPFRAGKPMLAHFAPMAYIAGATTAPRTGRRHDHHVESADRGSERPLAKRFGRAKDQTCAIKADTSLWCWGDNTNGQLGTGNTVPSTDPLQVTGTGWSQV